MDDAVIDDLVQGFEKHGLDLEALGLSHENLRQRFIQARIRESMEPLDTGLTQEKFAAKLGVTYPTINRWENGRAKPSPLALKQIEDLARGMGERGKDLLPEFFPGEES